jgi:Bacterial Ig domain/Bacterial Ig-like domain (group 2)
MRNLITTQSGIRPVFASTRIQRQRNPLRIIPLAVLALIVGVSFSAPSSYSAEAFQRAREQRSYVVASAIKLWPATAAALSLGSNKFRSVSAHSNPATTVECYTASGAWQNDPFAVQTTPFVAQFDMTPNTANMDGVTGLAFDPALYYDDLAAIVRFNVPGFIDAIDGDEYHAETAIPYTPGLTYHFRLVVYPASHMYTIYVTPPNSLETVLGANFRFRSSQSSTSSLSDWSLYSEIPSHTVCGFGVAGFASSDTTSPTASVIDPLANATVAGSVNVSASATDNIGVVGVQLKLDGLPIRNELSSSPYTSSWDTTAVPNGTHIITATARDASGNAVTSAPVTVTVSNAQSKAACPASNSIFQNKPIAPQSAQFQASFDATPSLSNMDGHTGLSFGSADASPRLAVDVRFNSSGFIDARNGGSFAAKSSISYVAGQKYHFRLIIDPNAHLYTIFVTPPGSSEITLGTNFAFQINFSILNYWVLYSPTGSLSICNFTLGSASPSPDFSLSAAPGSQTVPLGNSAMYNVSIGSLNGFSGSVNLNASGLPTGTAATFAPPTITGSGNSILTITTSASTPLGLSTITITGTSASGIHSIASTLTVTAAVLKSIVVTPTNSSATVGITVQFHATGTYSDKSTKDLAATVTWSSSNTTAATITAAGLATAVAAGHVATISAGVGTIKGSTTLTVIPALATYESESALVFNASKSSGPTYRILAWQGFTDGQGTTLDANAAGQSVTVTLNVPQSGIYDVKVATKAHNTRGIVQLTVKGAKVGPAEDGYSANDVWKQFDLGNVSLPSGNVAFVFTTVGKNAASLGFTQAFDYIKLARQQ